jgi:membrane-bound metal-dependent hydrolase YbcI (DUF457 family)
VPSPVGHTLAALTVHAVTSRARTDLLDPRRISVSLAAGLAPDLDLLVRFIDGRNHHQAQSHSLGFALLAAAAVLLIARWRAWPAGGRLALLAGAAWTSHVLLDYLGRDTHPPIGLMALWPVSSGYFKFPWPLFSDIGRRLDGETMRHNAVAVAWEAVLLVPPLLLSCWRHRIREDAR